MNNRHQTVACLQSPGRPSRLLPLLLPMLAPLLAIPVATRGADPVIFPESLQVTGQPKSIRIDGDASDWEELARRQQALCLTDPARDAVHDYRRMGLGRTLDLKVVCATMDSATIHLLVALQPGSHFTRARPPSRFHSIYQIYLGFSGQGFRGFQSWDYRGRPLEHPLVAGLAPEQVPYAFDRLLETDHEPEAFFQLFRYDIDPNDPHSSDYSGWTRKRRLAWYPPRAFRFGITRSGVPFFEIRIPRRDLAVPAAFTKGRNACFRFMAATSSLKSPGNEFGDDLSRVGELCVISDGGRRGVP